jgi:uncharacterized protein (TIGR00369 family)
MKELPSTNNCFACGQLNASGLRLKMEEAEGGVVRATFRPRQEHAGFSHAVHGGITTAALDEIMAWAVIVATRKPAYSAEFTVRFHRPVKVGSEYRLAGEVILNRKNRLFETRGELKDEHNVLCAAATGKYLPLSEQEARLALEDFSSVRDAADWLGLSLPALPGS